MGRYLANFVLSGKNIVSRYIMRIYTFATEKIEDQWLSMVYNDSYDYLVLRNHHVCKMLIFI